MFKLRVKERYRIIADYAKYLGKTWVHYTDHEQLKFNIKPFHLDPVGIYFFPESFRTGGGWHAKPYKFTARVKPGASILDMSEVATTEDARELLVKLKAWDDKYKPEQISGKPARWAWTRLQETFTGRKGAFTKAFMNAGYDGVFDDTDSIFSGEDQLIVFNQKILTDVKRTDQGSTGYKEAVAILDTVQKLLQDYDGKVTALKKPRKEKPYSYEPPAIRGSLTFGHEERQVEYESHDGTMSSYPAYGREVTFKVETHSEYMGSKKKRPATGLRLSAKGTSDAHKEHLSEHHSPMFLTWRLEEYDPAQIQPWLAKIMKLLWDDEEVLREKQRGEDQLRSWEERDKVTKWAEDALPLAQKPKTPQAYKNLISKVLNAMRDIASDRVMKKPVDGHMEKLEGLIQGLKEFQDRVPSDGTKAKIGTEADNVREWMNV